MPLLRTLTDRGSAFQGRPEQHAYERYLPLENMDHSLTGDSPPNNDRCERLHRTIQEAFYAIAFRNTLYPSLKQLQVDLNDWFLHYTLERPKSGRHSHGKTPLETFLAIRTPAKEKQLDELPPAA